jgi:choline transport protein
MINCQRRFGFLSILGFSCTVLITWEGSLVQVHILQTQQSSSRLTLQQTVSPGLPKVSYPLHRTRLTLKENHSGGTAGVIYGYLLVWLGTVSVFMVLSELVSM